MRHKVLVKGDVNLLKANEILITEEEGYTILREKTNNGELKTSVIVPLEDFTNKKE